MNWTDLAVIAIIAVSGLIGLKKGFIYSAFKLVSFFAAALIAFKFHPVMSKFLTEHTPLYKAVKTNIMNSVLQSLKTQGNAAAGQAKENAIDAVMSSLSIPRGFRSAFSGQGGLDISKLVDMNAIADAISSNITEIIISIISVILLYFLVRILLFVVRIALDGAAKLPVFSQANRLGGFAFGAIEGLLSIYIICVVLNLLFMANQLKWMSEAIDSSVVAKHFYQNNIILNFFKVEDTRNDTQQI